MFKFSRRGNMVIHCGPSSRHVCKSAFPSATRYLGNSFNGNLREVGRARGRATFRSFTCLPSALPGAPVARVLSEISCAASAKAKYVISCGGKSQLSSDSPARVVVSPELYGGGKLNGETVRADYHLSLSLSQRNANSQRKLRATPWRVVSVITAPAIRGRTFRGSDNHRINVASHVRKQAGLCPPLREQ